MQATSGGSNSTIICQDIVMTLARPLREVVSRTTGPGSSRASSFIMIASSQCSVNHTPSLLIRSQDRVNRTDDLSYRLSTRESGLGEYEEPHLRLQTAFSVK